MAPSSEMDYLGAFKRLSKCIGNKPINEYSIDDIRKFKDTLLIFPIGDINKIDNIHNYIKQVSTKNKNYRKISPVTVQKIIIRLHTVFNYAVANGYLSSNPASQIQVFVPKKTEPARLPFTVKELNKIFSSNLYRENKNKDKSRIQDFRMLILLGFFTGGRMEELARLTTNDIGCENGIYYIYIHGERDTTRRVKNVSSIRRIPLHSKLLELGFDDYYRKMLTNDHDKFFPSLYRSKEIRGKITHYFSKWFGLFLDGLGITDKTKSFHSFRHTMKRLLRDAGIEKSVCDAYQGHSMGDIASTYGRDEYNMGYSLSFLKEQIERIDYSQIDFRYAKFVEDEFFPTSERRFRGTRIRK
jgi:integrase